MTDNNNKSTSITTVKTSEESEWGLLQRQCKAWLSSQLLPPSITDVAKAITVVMTGKELGLPPLISLREINIVQGKPSLSSQVMTALVYQKVKGAVINFLTSTDKQSIECTVEVSRPGGAPQQFRYTIDMAKSAGLTTKNNWKQHPEAMLRARTVAAAIRAVFPDALSSCYLPDELGIIDIESAAPESTERKIEVSKSAVEPFETIVAPTKRNRETVGTIGEWDKASPGWEKKPASTKQIKFIADLALQQGLDAKILQCFLKDKYKIEKVELLPAGLVDEVLRDLKGENK